MINQLAKEIHENAVSKGFWDKDRNLGEMLMLIVSEVSEAMEADRKSRYTKLSKLSRMNLAGQDNSVFLELFKIHVKDTFEDELADACVRIFDLAYSRCIDLEWHIKQKMRYNTTREKMHGKKY